jgi:adenylate cyclase
VPPQQEQRVERRLAAIFAADVAGYSRLMSQDEAGTLRALSAAREIMDRLIGEHGGRIANTAGDSVLAEFASAVDAVECAVIVQERLRARDAGVPEARVLRFRIGIHVGDVVVRAGDLLGDGVNIAARLEGVAEPGGICLSGAAYAYVKKALSLTFADLGEQEVKNIDEPVRAYSVLLRGGTAQHAELSTAIVPAPDRPCVGVLPFNVFGGGADLDGLADGITEDIITELSRFSGLAVIARNSTFAFKGRPVEVKQAARDLGARYIIEGSVRQAGERTRITAQLIEAATGNHVWAERYDRNAAEGFELQDDVTRSVVASAQTHILLNEGLLIEQGGKARLSIAERATRGWSEIYQLTSESLDRALHIGRSMVQDAPRSAKGHQLIGAAAYHLTMMGFVESREASRSEALVEASEAVRLDDRDEYSQWILAAVQGNLFGKLEDALATYRRAFEINPNFSLIYGSMGMTLAHSGRADESIEHTLRAMQMNPRDPSVFFRYSSMALAHHLRGEHAEALDWAHRSIARKRNWWVSHATLIASLWATGRFDAASSAAQALKEEVPLLRASALPLAPVAELPEFADFRDALRHTGVPE